MIEVYYKPQLTAERFDGSADMIKNYSIGTMPAMQIDLFGDLDDENNWSEPSFNIQTLGGKFQLHVGDWIITEATGYRFLISNEKYLQLTKELPVIPSEIANIITTCKQQGEELTKALSKLDIEMRQYVESHGEDVAYAWLYGYQLEAQHD